MAAQRENGPVSLLQIYGAKQPNWAPGSRLCQGAAVERLFQTQQGETYLATCKNISFKRPGTPWAGGQCSSAVKVTVLFLWVAGMRDGTIYRGKPGACVYQDP